MTDPGKCLTEQAEELERPRVYQLPACPDLPARWNWACPCGHVSTWPHLDADRANSAATVHAKHCDTAKYRALRSAVEDEVDILTAYRALTEDPSKDAAYRVVQHNLRSVLDGFAA